MSKIVCLSSALSLQYTTTWTRSKDRVHHKAIDFYDFQIMFCCLLGVLSIALLAGEKTFCKTKLFQSTQLHKSTEADKQNFRMGEVVWARFSITQRSGEEK